MKAPTLTKSTLGFDIIGDVHGDADQLKNLLKRLEYDPAGGIWRHPEGRRVIYVGDLVDRGSKARETLAIARGMVDHGAALMVLGNHEWNLLTLFTPNGKGGYLRPQSEKNLKMCRTTLANFAGRDAELNGYLAWFRTLPLYLDLGGLRVVHAEWDDRLIAGLNGRTFLDDGFLAAATTKGTGEHRTIETLLKGTEIPLPGGISVRDSEGAERGDVRVCWPLPAAGRTYRGIALSSATSLPETPVPPEIAAGITGYHSDAPPVFFGHYGLNGWAHGLITRNAACLDLGCAKGGPLVAYRWNGERTLSAEKLVSAT